MEDVKSRGWGVQGFRRGPGFVRVQVCRQPGGSVCSAAQRRGSPTPPSGAGGKSRARLCKAWWRIGTRSSSQQKGGCGSREDCNMVRTEILFAVVLGTDLKWHKWEIKNLKRRHLLSRWPTGCWLVAKSLASTTRYTGFSHEGHSRHGSQCIRQLCNAAQTHVFPAALLCQHFWSLFLRTRKYFRPYIHWRTVLHVKPPTEAVSSHGLCVVAVDF